MTKWTFSVVFLSFFSNDIDVWKLSLKLCILGSHSEVYSQENLEGVGKCPCCCHSPSAIVHDLCSCALITVAWTMDLRGENVQSELVLRQMEYFQTPGWLSRRCFGLNENTQFATSNSPFVSWHGPWEPKNGPVNWMHSLLFKNGEIINY